MTDCRNKIEEVASQLNHLSQFMASLMEQLSTLTSKLEVLEDHLSKVGEIQEVLSKDRMEFRARQWTPQQDQYITSALFTGKAFLSEITAGLNKTFGPHGMAERSSAGVACRLYKLVEHSKLPRDVLELAEKYEAKASGPAKKR